MGSVITGWRRPNNVKDLARAVAVFIEDTFGFEGLDERDQFEGVIREVGYPHFEAEVIVTDKNRADGAEWMRLDKEGVRVVTAWYQAGRPTVDRILFPPRPSKKADGATVVRQTTEIRAAEGSDLSAWVDREGGFTPVKAYNRPKTRLELVQTLATFVQVELGMNVEHTTVVDDQPSRWIEMGLSGLDADIDGISVLVPESDCEAVGITGDTERELLEAFRAKLAALDLDDHERHMSEDRMPKGYTFDLLTDDEAEVVERYRKGKASPKPRRKAGRA